jgi:TetR/AcrR family transcriptional regulator
MTIRSLYRPMKTPLPAIQVQSTFLNLPEEKKSRILETAIHEFAEKGYDGSSINTMVSRLGISKGSIFQYFNNKKSLFFYVFDYAVGLVKRTLVQVKEETENEEVFERIRKSLLAGIGFIQKHPHIYRIYLNLQLGNDTPFRTEFIHKIRLFSGEYLSSLLRQGMERGEISNKISLNQAVFLLDAVLDRFLLAYTVPYLSWEDKIYKAPKRTIEEWADGLTELLRKGLQG